MTPFVLLYSVARCEETLGGPGFCIMVKFNDSSEVIC